MNYQLDSTFRLSPSLSKQSSRSSQQNHIIQKLFKLIQIINTISPMTTPSHPPSFFNWAYNHTDPADAKYSTNPHAIYVTITGTIIFQLATWLSSHLIFTTNCNLMRPQSIPFGYFLFVYLLFMMTSRYVENGSVAIYQFLWACNQALLLGAFAMIVQDSHLLRASIVIVSIDQLLWYVDLIGYVFKRKFIIGVAKYVIWPQTTKLRLMTTFHHVWYIPLVIWLTYPSIQQCGLNLQVFFLCCVMSLFLALIGKISAPKEVIVKARHHKHKQSQTQKEGNQKQGEQKEQQTRKVYLNLNISWELWKDVNIPFLNKLYRILPSASIPIFLSLFWDAGSFVGFVILILIQKII